MPPGEEARWERDSGGGEGWHSEVGPSLVPPSDSLPPWEVDGWVRPVKDGRLSITQVRRKEPLVSLSASQPGHPSSL